MIKPRGGDDLRSAGRRWRLRGDRGPGVDAAGRQVDPVGGAVTATRVSAATLDAHGRVDTGAPLDGEVVIVPGVARYHHSGCMLIRLLARDDLETSRRQEAEAAGCVACAACKPLSAQ